MNQMKKMFFSEIGMKVVNLLFFLSLFIRNCGVIFVAYAVWILYLLNCMKKTSSKTLKVVLSFFVIFASVMIVINLFFLFKIQS